MNTVKKLIVLMGLLSVLYAIPAMAQITTRVTFDAPAAFYAGNAKMPAGSYSVTQPNDDENLLLIERRHHDRVAPRAFFGFVVVPEFVAGQFQRDDIARDKGHVEMCYEEPRSGLPVHIRPRFGSHRQPPWFAAATETP